MLILNQKFLIQDILIRGNDGGIASTALTCDMSDTGQADDLVFAM